MSPDSHIARTLTLQEGASSLPVYTLSTATSFEKENPQTEKYCIFLFPCIRYEKK